MALLTKQTSERAANDLTFAPATVTTGDTFLNTGRECVLWKNDSGAPVNVTITTPQTVDGGLTIADKVIAVGAGKIALLGPWPKATYNDDDDLVKITGATVTDQSLAVVDVARS